MSTPPVDLATLRAFLDLSDNDTTEDAELSAMLEAATDVVEARVGPMVTQVRTDQTVYAQNGRIVLPRPLLSVESISFNGGDPYDLTLLSIDTAAGVVSSAYGNSFAYWFENPNAQSRPFTVSYTVGRGTAGDVPQPLKYATMLVAEQMWKTQRGNASSAAARFGGSTEQVYTGFLWPARAEALIAPYEQYAFT